MLGAHVSNSMSHASWLSFFIRMAKITWLSVWYHSCLARAASAAKHRCGKTRRGAPELSERRGAAGCAGRWGGTRVRARHCYRLRLRLCYRRRGRRRSGFWWRCSCHHRVDVQRGGPERRRERGGGGATVQLGVGLAHPHLYRPRGLKPRRLGERGAGSGVVAQLEAADPVRAPPGWAGVDSGMLCVRVWSRWRRGKG